MSRQALPAEFAEPLCQTRDRRGPFGEPLHYYEEIGSTNDVAGALASAGASEGTVVLAAAQRSGRGRAGHSWASPPGAGLYFSVVFRAHQPRGASESLLTLAAGVAISEAIEAATGLHAEIKWPNDLVVERGGRAGVRHKLAGILAEGSTVGERLDYVVLGVGINVGQTAYPAEIASRATSIEAELGRPVDAGLLFAECLARLAWWRGQLIAGERPVLLDAWTTRSPSCRGRHVRIVTGSGERAGVTDGVDESGALVVQTANGLERVMAGEVAWE